jgi:hypothetical protein
LGYFVNPLIALVICVALPAFYGFASKPLRNSETSSRGRNKSIPPG